MMELGMCRLQSQGQAVLVIWLQFLWHGSMWRSCADECHMLLVVLWDSKFSTMLGCQGSAACKQGRSLGTSPKTLYVLRYSGRMSSDSRHSSISRNVPTMQYSTANKLWLLFLNRQQAVVTCNATFSLGQHTEKRLFVSCQRCSSHRIFQVIHCVNDLIMRFAQPQHDTGLGVHSARLCSSQNI